MTEAKPGGSQSQIGPGGHGADTAELERKYVRMWVILAVLPMLSVAAYLTGIRSLAILTSILVIVFSTFFATTTFMHVNAEPRFVPYLCILAFVFSALYLFLTSPDVMMHSGQQWVNVEAERHEAHSGHGAGAPAHGSTLPEPETGAQYQRTAPAEAGHPGATDSAEQPATPAEPGGH